MKSFKLSLIALSLIALQSNAQNINTIAGDGSLFPSADSIPALEDGMNPVQVRLSPDGSYYIHGGGNSIRRVMPDGLMVNFAGYGASLLDGIPAVDADFKEISNVKIDKNGMVYVSDCTDGNRVRKIDPTTGIITTICGDGATNNSGDGGLAVDASILTPTGMCFDKDDNLLILAGGYLRKIDAGGIITTIAGLSGTNTASPNQHIAVDTFGNIYASVTKWLFKYSPTGQLIDTIAGNGTLYYTADGIPADEEGMTIYDFALDAEGRIFIADHMNHRIRKIENGIITTVVGTGDYGFAGEGGPAAQAQLNFPKGVERDTCGNLYIADENNHRVRKVSYDATCGIPIPVSVLTTEKNTSCFIYPNPASAEVTIKSNEKISSVAIVDVTGRVVLQRTVNSEQVTVDVSELSSGVYFVKAGGSIVKFVKE
jgi:hypothetical protein